VRGWFPLIYAAIYLTSKLRPVKWCVSPGSTYVLASLVSDVTTGWGSGGCPPDIARPRCPRRHTNTRPSRAGAPQGTPPRGAAPLGLSISYISFRYRSHRLFSYDLVPFRGVSPRCSTSPGSNFTDSRLKYRRSQGPVKRSFICLFSVSCQSPTAATFHRVDRHVQDSLSCLIRRPPRSTLQGRK
jgi:hypothetical protein